MKTCRACKKSKPDEAFPVGRLRRDGTRGRRAMCHACAWEQQKAARAGWSEDRIAKHNERQRVYVERYATKNPHMAKASKANLHARRVGAKGRLLGSDVLAVWQARNGCCWVCGFPATEIDHYRPINRKSGGTNTADNILPICRECNQKRSHLWHGEVIAMKEAEMLKALKLLLHGSDDSQQRVVGTTNQKGGER